MQAHELEVQLYVIDFANVTEIYNLQICTQLVLCDLFDLFLHFYTTLSYVKSKCLLLRSFVA